jgi:hypothetical protein
MSDLKVPIAKPNKLGPESNLWFWNPRREPTKRPSESFSEQLASLDPDLRAVWNPVEERWAIWVKSPRFQTPICQGWRLLFIHRAADGSYLPLDELVFARIYTIDSHRVGDARKYFERISSEMDREREQRERQFTQDSIDAAMPSFDYSQIKVAGFGKSNGSKFADFHS